RSKPGGPVPLHRAVQRRALSPSRAAIVVTGSATAISWICWLPLVASDHQMGHVPAAVAPLLIMLGTFGPLLAAVSMVARVSGFGGWARSSARHFAGERACAGTWWRWRSRPSS